MEPKMSAASCQKKENFSVVRGARYAQRPARIFTTAELRLDRDMADIVGAIKGANGKHPSRGFQRVAYEEAFPWRVLARWFVVARKARAPKPQLVAVLTRLYRFVDGLYDDAQDLAA
jgi:hypothetical protein